MLFSTLPFLLFAALTVVATNTTRKGLNNAALYFLINAVFLALFFGRLEATLLIAFTIWGYAMLRVLELKVWRAAAVGILSSLIVFVILKKYRFLPASARFEGIPAIVGLSYVLFRVLHLLVDTHQERGQAPGLVGYLNYALSCFSLVSGPFQPFGEHEASISAARDGDAMAALSRICNGFLKTMILAPALLRVHLLFTVRAYNGVTHGTNLAALSLGFGPRAEVVFVFGSIVAALVWMVFLYLNFSGYTDIVIGWAALCRLELPENFNAPFRAASFLDFWNRWHMSMTGWFKTYLFTPTLKALTVRRPQHAFALFNTVTAFVVTFLLMGLWHGPDWPFAICGLLLALGAAINHIYHESLRRRFGSRRMTELGERTWYRAFSAGLTFTYIGVVIAPFWMANQEYLRLLRDLAGPPVLVFAIICVGTGIFIELIRCLADSITEFWARAWLGRAWLIPAAASIAIRLNVLALAVLVSYKGIPDFVYKGF